MQACPPDDLLKAFLEEQAEADHGDCSLTKWSDFAAHLDVCESCCRKLDLLTGKGTADKGQHPSERDFLERLAASPEEMLARQQAKVQPPQIDGYEILAELGRGGMGVVYKAQHTRLDRTVALKMILAGGHAGAAELERFRREAEALARLQHPNIVQIFEVGEHQGVPYFALEFVEGGTLEDKLKDTPLPPRHAARMTALLAQAVQAAHERGIVHRDLKPANVFLMPTKDKEGIPIADRLGTTTCYLPKIGDFGLAKKLDEEHGQTQSGAVMGTPSYMAPEQAEGKSRQMSPAVDVYALGAILYDLLTGRPPFKGESTLETLEQVRSHNPVPPRQLQPKVPRDLETICLKCLAKTSADRYASAHELAEDLGRFLRGEPIRARPVPAMERAWHWCRRNPLVASLLIAVAMSLILGAGVAWLFALQAHAAKRDADERRKQAETLVIQLKFEDAIRQPQENRAWSMFTAAGLLRDATTLENRPLQDSLRLHLGSWFQEVHPLKCMLSHKNVVDAVAFSPDGKIVLTGSRDRTAQLWEASTGKRIGLPLLHLDTVRVVAFSPDGETMLTGSENGTAQLWETATGKPFGLPLRHQTLVSAVAFSPNGKTVLTGSGDHTARLWEIATGKEIAPLPHKDLVAAVAFSPDGKTVLTGSWDRTARLWEAATGRSLGSPLQHEGKVDAVAFSPDGKTVLTGSHDRTARLWETDTGNQLASLQHRDAVKAVAFSPDGKTVLTGSDDDTAQLWETATGQPLGPPLRHQNWVSAVAFSLDGKTVLTGSHDNTARLWEAATGKPLGPPLHHQRAVCAVAFSPDGKTVLTASRDHTARLWEIATGRLLGPPLQHEFKVCAMAFSPDRKTVLTGNHDSTAQLWHTATGEKRASLLPHHQGRVRAVAFSQDGTTVLTGSEDKTAQLWATATGQPIGPRLPHGYWVMAVAFSPDGQTMLTGSWDQTAQLWETATGSKRGPPLQHQSYVSAVAFSPDGKTVLTGSWDRTARLWEASTGNPLDTPPIQHPNCVSAVAFSPDGKTIATGCWDYTARLWQTATGQPLRPPMRHQAKVRHVSYSPDGKILLTLCEDNTAWLWETATALPLGSPFHHPGRLLTVAFNTDSKTVLTGSSDKTTGMWRVPASIEGDPERILLWAQVITGLELDEYGGTRGLDAATWQQRRQRLQELGGPP